MLAPKSAQLKVDLLKVRLLILQLSELPLFICEAVMVAEPELFRLTLIFWVTTKGLMVSKTVIITLAALAFPL